MGNYPERTTTVEREFNDPTTSCISPAATQVVKQHLTFDGMRNQVIGALTIARRELQAMEAYINTLEEKRAEVERLERLLDAIDGAKHAPAPKARPTDHRNERDLQIAFRDAMRDLGSSGGRFDREALARHMACSPSWASAQLKAAERQGIIRMVGKEGRKPFYVYSPLGALKARPPLDPQAGLS